jgi:hypothetical protein
MTTLGQVLIIVGFAIVVSLQSGGPAATDWLVGLLRYLGFAAFCLGLYYFRVGLKRDIIAEIKGGESSTSKPPG